MKISPNGVDKESLIKINEEIREKMKIKRPRIEGAFKAPKTYSKSLKSLEKLLISQIMIKTKPGISDKQFTFSSLFPILKSLEPSYNTTCAFQDLYDSFYIIFENFPNIDKDTMRIIKYFSQTYEKTQIKQLEKLSSKVYDFYLFWKLRKIRKELENEKKTSCVANAKLRKHVCRKLALVLQEKNIGIREAQVKALSYERQEKNIGIREAQVKALSYERQVRNTYPEMGEEYVKNCKLLLKKIKSSD
ncbi:hypothetical protein SteCoe_14473 [Stentor coeruleus]|uniref:Uncharacterized protein n=1 Tax=Stentor coeruleus TaxID=5963 RepID=A0A1R2C602_9CILI|nr:hypothetical protein SteCoe_14473 [Stentor coeruleus]